MPVYDLRCPECGGEAHNVRAGMDEVLHCGACAELGAEVALRRIPRGCQVLTDRRTEQSTRRPDGAKWADQRDRLSTGEGMERVCYDVARSSGLSADRARAAAREAAPIAMRKGAELRAHREAQGIKP